MTPEPCARCGRLMMELESADGPLHCENCAKPTLQMKTWNKSLKRKIQAEYERLARRHPDIYRRLTVTEVTELVRMNADRLTGPVNRIVYHGPARAGCKLVPLTGPGGYGGAKAECRI